MEITLSKIDYFGYIINTSHRKTEQKGNGYQQNRNS